MWRTRSDAGRAAEPRTSRGRGRPRDARIDERILRATLDVLGTSGYAQMSVSAVAAAAGVSKPTIYRRWPSKVELATAAISLMAAEDPLVEHANVWEGLHAELVLFDRAIDRGHGLSIIGTLLAHEELHPRLIAQYRDRVARRRRGRIRRVLTDGIRDGQLPEDTDIDLIVNMLLGYYYSTHIGGEGRPDDWPSVCIALVRRALCGPERAPVSPDG